jgi:hypothetical protein
MKRLALVTYGLFGTVAVGLGVIALLAPALALPREAHSPLTAHLIREQGAEGVFIGLMAFWCLLHFEARRPVHYALLLLTALFATIHWADYFNGPGILAIPVINSLPFLFFAATAPWTRPPVSRERL